MLLQQLRTPVEISARLVTASTGDTWLGIVPISYSQGSLLYPAKRLVTEFVVQVLPDARPCTTTYIEHMYR